MVMYYRGLYEFKPLNSGLGCTTSDYNVISQYQIPFVSLSVSLYIPSSQFLPDGKRMISGASSGEFTLWSGNNLYFRN